MKFPTWVTRRSVAVVFAHAAVLSLVAGARGWMMALALDGRVPVSAFLIDAAGLGAIVLLLHLFNRGLTFALDKALRPRSGPGRALSRAIVVLIILVVGGPLLVVIVQFHPQRISSAITPRDAGIGEYQEVTFWADRLRLSGWFIPATQPGRPIILLAHGIGANKQNLLYPASLMHESGYGVFLFDFRAHGDSAGFTATFGLNESRDIRAAYDWLARHHPGHPIYALGYSMGGSAVLKAAADYGIFRRIVVDSTFSTLENVARATVLRRLGILATPTWQMGRFWSKLWTGTDLADNCPARNVASFARQSVLIIHGLRDQMIPPDEAMKLYEAGRPHSDLWLVANADHMQNMLDPEYRNRLADFFGGGE
jgi:pimeloyl-ACP methyl ester carboxylesterase